MATDAAVDGALDGASADATRADAGPFTVVSTVPAASGVTAVSADISATCSRNVAPGSVNQASLTVTRTLTSTVIPGSVSASGAQVTFSPTAALTGCAGFRARLEGVTASDGTPLAAPHEWTFVSGPTRVPAAELGRLPPPGGKVAAAGLPDAVIAFWVQGSGGAFAVELRAAVGNAAGWQPSTVVTSQISSTSDVLAASDAAGNVFVLWNSGNDLWVARRTVAGTWDSPVMLGSSSISTGARKFDLAVGPAGDAAVVHIATGGVVVRRYSGGSWLAAESLAGNTPGPFGPRLAAGAGGELFAVWSSLGSIIGRRYVPATGWEVATTIDDDAGVSADDYAIAAGPTGAYLFFVQRNGGGGASDMHGRRFAAATGWGAERQIGVLLNGATSLSAAMNDAGVAAAAWTNTMTYSVTVARDNPSTGAGFSDYGVNTFVDVALTRAGNDFVVAYNSQALFGYVAASRLVPATGAISTQVIHNGACGDTGELAVAATATGAPWVIWRETIGRPVTSMVFFADSH